MIESGARVPAGWRWRPLLLLTPFQFIFGIVYAWGAMSPAIHTQRGWPVTTLDLAFSLTPLALLLAVVWAGHGLQWLSPKAMLAAALGCFTIGGAVSVAARVPLLFVLGYNVLALGIGAGLSTAACIAMISRLYPERRGVLGGALLALYGTSSVVSATLFQALDSRLGWNGALAALLSLYAALGWLAWFWLPALPRRNRHAGVGIRLITLLRHRPLRWALVLVLLSAPLGSASFATIGRLGHALGFDGAFALAAVSIMAAGNGAGRLCFGIVADLRSARSARNFVLAINAIAAAILLAVQHGLDNLAFAPYPLLAALAFGGMAGKLPALAAHVVEDGYAEPAFGLLFGTFAFASFLGPAVSAEIGMREALDGFAICAIAAWPLARLAP